MWVCFPPSDDYYTLEPRVADKVHCENQLEILETTFKLLESCNHFYCTDLFGAGRCIETTKTFQLLKSGNYCEIWSVCLYLLSIMCLLLKMDQDESPIARRQ